MICQKCQKQHATVHLTEIVNNEKREAHLCEECAHSSGVGVKFSFSVQDILGNLIEGKAPKSGKAYRNLSCPNCGLNYGDFKAKARLGCAHDYDVFGKGLGQLLEKIHGSTQHVGKVPKTAEVQVQKENELVKLQRELDTLIKSEDFEKAAEVRDRIKSLETELNAGG
jgi:protein arginine kinase activator